MNDTTAGNKPAQPRGIRNNNPGNIRWGSPWQGLVPADKHTDPDFCQFISAAWGIRALCRILITYKDSYGLDTISKIIGRWAPSSENDTASYIADVSLSMNKGADDVIDTHTYEDMLGLVIAIIRHENGQQPYDVVTLSKGLQLAGIVRVVNSPLHTRIGKAVATTLSTGGIAAGVASVSGVQPATEAIKQAAAGHPTLGTIASIGVFVLVLIAFGGGVFAYREKQKSIAAESGPA